MIKESVQDNVNIKGQILMHSNDSENECFSFPHLYFVLLVKENNWKFYLK